MLLQQEDGQAVAMGMDAYLLGAVLAEMPADFEGEALKAQAVAAITFARRAYVTGGKHGDGAVCTNYACCQAYIAPEDYLQRGGTQEDVDWVRSCVEATSDLVLTYEGALIEATYFSCSGGRTEDAEAVWGTEYPYLQAVDSPGEENAAHYRDTVWFMPEFFAGLLGLELTGNPEEWFGETEYTDGGGVDTMTIGDTLFRGSCGRTDLPGGSKRDIRNSLRRLAELPQDYSVHPGHGESTTLAWEKQYNPYMR